jgi:hypothetical protein
MKKSLIVLMMVLLATACTPFRWVAKPIKMNHAATFYAPGKNGQDSVIGYILCHSYRIENETLILDSAGYYPKLRNQRSVATVLIPNRFWKYTITTLYR